MTPHPSRLDRTATMLRASGIFAVGLAALLVAVGVATVAWAARDGRIDDRAKPTFSTSASGTVEIPPSSATTRVGLQACGAGPGGALQLLNSRFASMSKSWRTATVSERDISRGGVSTWKASQSRWCSSLDAVVTVDDLDLVDEVLSGIARYPRGIQSVTGPTFDYDPAKLEEGALDEAMRVARRKADDAARRAGTSVVGVASIVEGGVSIERPEDAGRPQIRYAEGASKATGSATDVRADMDSLAQAVGSASGEATATVSVEAVFRLAE
jgi:uncharacterized protein YggE